MGRVSDLMTTDDVIDPVTDDLYIPPEFNAKESICEDSIIFDLYNKGHLVFGEIKNEHK